MLRGRVTDVSLLSELFMAQAVKRQKLLMLLRCRTTDVVLLKREEYNFNISFLNIESGIVNRLHIDLILSVIAAARFQIQTER